MAGGFAVSLILAGVVRTVRLLSGITKSPAIRDTTPFQYKPAPHQFLVFTFIIGAVGGVCSGYGGLAQLLHHVVQAHAVVPFH